ncbi:acyl-ACP--UDP-N-acetylglucosamine O-acyltransferase [Candidatus Nitrosacidococcus sp. I8]|uniref:acyl-ACP--UDP-N-acetylglucosamine O-acyltransferase n=1 Tax=Candidatus Nitrosacidococcus sp. I8 TaxID=2942908 RepID=UPI002227F3C3|nr:acyl-ACP--UDP-N-acetylglucosamine O-acyltransferase [Candidatus Nitrosacidococcus sp. I8]CAH9017998.1 Acyl-[acyl-carrier-protein]--UDP-N-acetylglucosamine O-acyltransferase [Candidatus Nitrosacidococcus sp. I8]
MSIHSTAIIDPNATLGKNVTVGPYTVIHAPVTIGDGTSISSHVVIHSYVQLGTQNKIHSHVVIGDLPQDLSFDKNIETWVSIGDRNILREGVTIHRSTHPDRPTKIGNDGYFMAYSHIAHDCSIGNHVILTNNALLGGHVEIGNRAVLGGSAVVHQYARIGAYAMVQGNGSVGQDVFPYTIVGGHPVHHYRLNVVGLRRGGIQGQHYRVLEQAFWQLRNGNRDLSNLENTPEITYLRNWLLVKSKRGFHRFAVEKEDSKIK